MGHLDVNAVSFSLPDGRRLLRDVTFRVGEGAKVALIGPNGTGKTTLLRILAGDLTASDGAVTRSGGLGVMRQFIGKVRDDTTVRDLLVSVAPDPVRLAALEVDRTELAMMERETEQDQLDYAQALSDWGDVGGYEWETLWDVCTVAALGTPFDRAQWRKVSTLSGGEQKRVVLEALLRGPDEVLVLDEPDNYLDVPTKRWLEARLVESPKTVLFVSHDRELLDRVATRIATLEQSSGGNTVWVHPGRFSTYEQARVDRNDRLDELRRRWDEEHVKLKELVVMYRVKATYNDGMASRLRAAETRLRRFEEAGPPEAVPLRQKVAMRLTGGRTAKRAVVATALELKVDGGQLMRPFDTEIWFGERVGVLGSNGSGKSHFLRLLAAGGSDPDREHEPVGDIRPDAGRARGPGRARLAGATGLVRADPRPRLPARAHPARDPAPRRRPPRRDAARPRRPHARPLRAGEGLGADLRLALGRPAGAAADPAARAVGGDPAAARRADRQPRPALGRGPRGRPRRLRGHRARGDPRPLVRPRFRPLPRVPRRRQGGAERRAGVGRGAG